MIHPFPDGTLVYTHIASNVENIHLPRPFLCLGTVSKWRYGDDRYSINMICWPRHLSAWRHSLSLSFMHASVFEFNRSIAIPPKILQRIKKTMGNPNNWKSAAKLELPHTPETIAAIQEYLV